jgi:ribosomal protein S18 acetylase RimI-like enzyme
MEIRPITPADVDRLGDIDGTIDSTHYIHVQRGGEGAVVAWTLEERPLRSELILSNPIDDETRLLTRQIAAGADEGLALLAEHDAMMVACAVAQTQESLGLLRLADLRVDSDMRRQGLATVMLYQLIQEARQHGLRAVMAQTRTNNVPAARLLLKIGFQLAGMDAMHYSNHDLVKEAVALFWYAALD